MRVNLPLKLSKFDSIGTRSNTRITDLARLVVFIATFLALVATPAVYASEPPVPTVKPEVVDAAEFKTAWRSPQSALVLDAYEFTPLDWTEIPKNERLVGFINKASDGLPPKYCGDLADALCRNIWRRYALTKELYQTRRTLAKAMGLKWGAYHLARPGNPVRQAQHFLSFTQPDENDLIALDIEDNDPEKWMSFEDAEIFARYIKAQTGRYPVLYTNHNTARAIARNRGKYRLLSQLNLWYARYKPEMAEAFPMGNWERYTLWQFSSMINCNKRECPRRIRGADHRIDVNVAWMSPGDLRRVWPFGELTAAPTPPYIKPLPEIDPPVFIARARLPSEKSNVLAYAAEERKTAAEEALDAAIRPDLRPKKVDDAKLMWVQNPPKPTFRPATKFAGNENAEPTRPAPVGRAARFVRFTSAM